MIKSPYTYPMTLKRVVDGDTIDVELDLGFDIRLTERVRLYDLDTPEIFGKNNSPDGYWAKLYTFCWFTGADYLTKRSLITEWFDIQNKFDRQIFNEAFGEMHHLYEHSKRFLLDSREYNARGKYGRVLGTIYRYGDNPACLNDDLLKQGFVK